MANSHPSASFKLGQVTNPNRRPLSEAARLRCRLHGGAKGSGAPKGNQNALKHGEYSAKSKANEKRRYKRFLKKLQALPEEKVFFWRGKYWII